MVGSKLTLNPKAQAERPRGSLVGPGFRVRV